MSAYIGSHASPVGYDVRLSRGGYLVGWVKFDHDEGLWRGFCREWRCGELPTGRRLAFRRHLPEPKAVK
jgi:hypothetical protein